MKKKAKKSMPGDMFKAFQAKKGMKKKAKKSTKKKSIGQSLAGPMASAKVANYHDKAQGFIKSAKGMGMNVTRDGSELIAGKKKKAKKAKKMKMMKNDHDADDKKKAKKK